MIYISHRGNIDGINENRENSPEYINEAIKKGFDVEVDVWKIGQDFMLGHDKPQYKVDRSFLVRPMIWCHAKNIDALRSLLRINSHCFWHEEDQVTLTSRGFIWTYPGNELNNLSVCVLPETIEKEQDLKKCAGICSDLIGKYRND